MDRKSIDYNNRSPYGIRLIKPDGAPLRILQVIPNLNLGGAEQSCIDIAKAIQSSGGQSFVVSNGGQRAHEAGLHGGRHFNCPVHRKNPYLIWKNIGRLAKIIRQHKIDIVHARSRAPAWAAYYAARRTDIPFMTTFHAAYKFKSGLKKRYNSVMTRGVHTIAISEFIKDHIQENYGLEDGQISVAYRGLSLDKFHPNAVSPERMIQLARQWRVPEDKAVILMPARLSRIKGHGAVIEALGLLKRRDAICIMVGGADENDPYYKELSEMIRSRKLAGQVKIVGRCIDMPAAYSMATCVVSTSAVPEGFGRVPVEAQAMGKPVIASNIGATVETIVEGETGFLVPPNNPVAISKALQKILNMSAAERNALGSKAMNRVADKFSLDAMCKVVLNSYLKVSAAHLNDKKEAAPSREELDKAA